jgi:DNA-3-methyladenine glycosylase II
MNSLFQKARRHLARRDPILRQIIRTIGPCTLRPNANRFAVLAQSIISQQISTKAATAIRNRLIASLSPKGITVAGARKASDEVLRIAGLSAAKIRALRDLADRIYQKTLPLAGLHALPDEGIIAQLVPVRGIGIWTAQMFLIFSLGRLDVLPVADFGLRNGVQRLYGLSDLPGKAQLEELAELWRPYRSIATWYFWRSLGGVPQSD